MRFFLILFVFLLITSFIWPYVFIVSFFEIQKKIKNGEDYKDTRELLLAYISLLCMTISPFVIGILLISN